MSESEDGLDDEPLAPGAHSPARATSSVVLRAAVPEDAHGIADAHVASWRSAYAGLLPRSLLEGLSVERRAAQWGRDIAAGSYVVHVAVDDDRLGEKAITSPGQHARRGSGTILGFIATSTSRDEDAPPTTGELVAIYVHPDAEGRGIGTQLHRTALTTLAARCDVATLWVLDSNAHARAYYARRGWHPDGTMKTATLGDGTEIVEIRYARSLRIHL